MGLRDIVERIGIGAAKQLGLEKQLTKIVVNQYARRAAARPRPFSMVADYTSWESLNDTTYTGRHLPAYDHPKLPDAKDIVKLFIADGPREAHDTSLLFPFFAQWFTDSFLRTDSEDFKKNQSNHGIDLCQIYGMNRGHTRLLRMLSKEKKGQLRSQIVKGEEYGVPLFEMTGGAAVIRPHFDKLYSAANSKRVFEKLTDEQKMSCVAVGLEHGNSTLGNLLMNTLFLREHNRLAALLVERFPDWVDDRVFETARNISIVQLLKIVVEDYVRHITPNDVPLKLVLGFAEKENWYRTNWIAVEFNLLYRWHGLIPARFGVGDDTFDSTRMIARFDSHKIFFEKGVDQIVKSASHQKAGRIGLGNTQPFLTKVKEDTVKLSRNARLAPFNEYRKHFGLKALRSFDELTDDPKLALELDRLYDGDIDRVELLVGLFGESYSKSEIMGKLQLTMVAHDAFTHVLTNPLLAERVFNVETFSDVGMKEIEGVSGLADIVFRNTKLSRDEVSFKF